MGSGVSQVRDSNANGGIERAIDAVQGRARTFKSALYEHYKTEFSESCLTLPWLTMRPAPMACPKHSLFGFTVIIWLQHHHYSSSYFIIAFLLQFSARARLRAHASDYCVIWVLQYLLCAHQEGKWRLPVMVELTTTKKTTACFVTRAPISARPLRPSWGPLGPSSGSLGPSGGHLGAVSFSGRSRRFF